MDISILSPEDMSVNEKQIQSAFESDLSKLEDGLEFVKSELVIGTGRIDTLAFDTISNSPVFMEYKRRGAFGKDALIQVMEYLSWFAKDENRIVLLEKIIRQTKPEIEEVEPSIRLICVVPDIDDQIRNAIYAISSHVKVYSYVVARDTAGKIVIVPKLEVDNSEIETLIPSFVSPDEIVKKYPHLQETFSLLRAELKKMASHEYTTARSIRYKINKLFAVLRSRKKYVQLELKVGSKTISDSEFKYWRKGESPWGYTFVYPTNTLSEKVLNWIGMAKDYSVSEELDSGITGINDDEETEE